MVFNDTTTEKQGIVQDTYFEVSANPITYPIADLTRNANTALDKAVTYILASNQKWDFDDSNATDLPIGSTNIISGQQDYSFDEEYLVIKSIELSDSSGNWTRLLPIDTLTLDESTALTDFEGTGTPMYYDKLGESIMLYPIPNYNLTSGLKAYFQRKMNYFTTTDETKEPGFAKHLHKYIPLYCAYVYAAAKGLAKQSVLKERLRFYEGNTLEGGNDHGAISKFYSHRERDVVNVITTETINSI